MSKTQFDLEAVGVYKWPYTASDVRRLSEEVWGDRSSDSLSLAKEQLEGLFVVELLVRSGTGTFNAGQLAQAMPDDRDESTQVPYDESFWSADGSEYLQHDAPPGNPPYRVVFYLHYFDPSKPLVAEWGSIVQLPERTKLPARIANVLKQYLPP